MSQRKGFSLVELLVVIGIISVLIAIMLPIIASIRRSASTARCASNMRQLGIALIGYAGQNRSYFPPNSGASGQFWYLETVVGSYMTAPELVGRAGEIPAGAEPCVGLAGGVFRCPNDLDDSVRSYSMNLYASGDVSPRVREVLESDESPGRLFKHGSTGDSSKLLLLAESWSELPVTGTSPLMHTAQAIIGFRNTPAQRFGARGGVNWTTPPDATVSRFETRKSQIDFSRHRGGIIMKPMEDPDGAANFLFVDGHVTLHKQSELINKTESRSSYILLWSREDQSIEDRLLNPQ